MFNVNTNFKSIQKIWLILIIVWFSRGKENKEFINNYLTGSCEQKLTVLQSQFAGWRELSTKAAIPSRWVRIFRKRGYHDTFLTKGQRCRSSLHYCLENLNFECWQVRSLLSVENCKNENTYIYGCLNYFFVTVPHSNLFYLMRLSFNSVEQYFAI